MSIKLVNQENLRGKLRPLVGVLASELTKLIPEAVVEEVGSSSIQGCLTKGDVDFLVIVSKSNFNVARDRLVEFYEINDMDFIEYFESFKGKREGVDIGIQLCVNDNPFGFLIFKKAMTASPKLVDDYNKIKIEASGLDVDEYRKAKNKFIESVIKNNS